MSQKPPVVAKDGDCCLAGTFLDFLSLRSGCICTLAFVHRIDKVIASTFTNMKGKKTNLRERQIASIEYLKLNFPDHVHLIPEFLREQKIHQESDLWLQYTAAGLARLFEGYLEPAKSLLDPAGSESLKDSMQLAVIQKHLAHLQTQLQSKPDIKVMQRILESEVIAQLMQLNGKWTRNLIHCDSPDKADTR